MTIDDKHKPHKLEANTPCQAHTDRYTWHQAKLPRGYGWIHDIARNPNQRAY